MKKINVLLVIILVVCFLYPSFFVENFRLKLIEYFSYNVKNTKIKKSSLSQLKLKLLKLEKENKLLKEKLFFNKSIDSQIKTLQEIRKKKTTDPKLRSFFKRREIELKNRLSSQLLSIDAKIIFREKTSWNNFIWINVGDKTNKKLNQEIIAKNSPVLFKNAVVGVVEYVGEQASKVRLVTDPNINISVRALRGKKQNDFLLEKTNFIIKNLNHRTDIENKEETIETLYKLKKSLQKECDDKYLAKGEICGSCKSFFKKSSCLLKGTGFNYYFCDKESDCLDLRNDYYNKNSILKNGDILITTGLDGIFYEGFFVATVAKIFPIKEGAVSYEIEANWIFDTLDNLSNVLVLSPINTK